mgnify:FL=1|jgi:uncharacterized membrane protein
MLDLNTYQRKQTKILVITLSLIIILGAFLRFYKIGKQSFWWDEALSYSFIKGGIKDIFNSIRSVGGNMTLFYLLAAAWTRIVSVINEGNLRILSAVFSILSLPLTFITSKELFNDSHKGTVCGIFATLIMAINTAEVHYAQEFRSYSLTTFLTLISTFVFIRIVKEQATKTPHLFLYVLFTALALYSHLYAALLIISHILSLFFISPEIKKKPVFIKRLLICYFTILLLSIPLIVLSIYTGKGELSWIATPNINDLVELFYFLTGNYNFIALSFYLLLTVIGILWGNEFFFKQTRSSQWYFIVLFICIIFPVLFSYIFSITIKPIFNRRYFLMINPYLAMLIASGIASILDFLFKLTKNSLLHKLAAVSFFLVLAILAYPGLHHYYTRYEKENWREASEIVATNCIQSLLIYYPENSTEAMQFYIPSWDPVPNIIIHNFVKAMPRKEYVPFPGTDNVDKVCFVISPIHVDNAKNVQLIRDAIQQDFPIKSITELTGVTVEIYSR